jgi:hypothetical protein
VTLHGWPDAAGIMCMCVCVFNRTCKTWRNHTSLFNAEPCRMSQPQNSARPTKRQSHEEKGVRQKEALKGRGLLRISHSPWCFLLSSKQTDRQTNEWMNHKEALFSHLQEKRASEWVSEWVSSTDIAMRIMRIMLDMNPCFLSESLLSISSLSLPNSDKCMRNACS